MNKTKILAYFHLSHAYAKVFRIILSIYPDKDRAMFFFYKCLVKIYVKIHNGDEVYITHRLLSARLQ